MKRSWKKGLLLGMTGAMLLTGCQGKGTDGNGNTDNGEQEVSSTGIETVITGNGDSVTITGKGAVYDQGVVTITSAGTYRLSGTITEGQIAVNTGKDDDVSLILEGFSITNSSSAAINGIKSGSITIATGEGTENTVSDGAEYQYGEEGANEPDAAIFSKDDLIFEGGGTLTVNGNYSGGIRGKDDLTVKSGTYYVNAAGDGIKGKDSVKIEDGVFTVDAGGDGIQASNDQDAEKGYIEISGGTFTITAAAKGVKAATSLTLSGGTVNVESEDDSIHCNGDVRITGGTYKLATGDDGIHADNQVVIDDGTITVTESYEGIEGLSIDINGGVIDVVSEDDGMNAAGGNDGSGNQEFGMQGQPGGHGGGGAFDVTEGAYIKITGGTIKIDASGDGIDSNGDLTIEGGTIVVEGPVSNGDGALDYSGTGLITGGTLAVSGSEGMVQNFSEDSTQPVVTVYYSESAKGGTTWELSDSSETVLLSGTPAKDYRMLMISIPELTDGETYQITTGETVTEVTVNGMITQTGTPAGRGGNGGGGPAGQSGGGMKGGGRTGSEDGAPGDGIGRGGPGKAGEEGKPDTGGAGTAGDAEN